MKKLLLMFFLNFSLLLPSFAQVTTRYIDSEFTAEQTHTNQVYATSPELISPYQGESFTHNVDLTMHIFQPLGDDLQTRPMLVCLHGGGFVSGIKEHDDMMAFCQIFAEKGYVTATASYRLGMNFLSNTSGERAVYRGIQDGRALLRWIRENAVALGVDPNHIYLLGSSAGAFISLHNLYMDKETERPAGSYEVGGFTLDSGPDLGTLDATGDFTNQNSQANGIISLWGALQNTTLIEASDTQIPIFLVHGTADAIVPFGLGSPFQAPNLAQTYGSQLISQKLNDLSYTHEIYFVDGEGHEFYGVTNGNWDNGQGGNAYWDVIVEKVRDFLYSIHKPTASFQSSANGLVVAFTNTTLNGTTWFWDFGDGQTSTEQNPTHTYAQEGSYTVTLTANSVVQSVDIATTDISVSVTAVEDVSRIPITFSLLQNYPNPFNPTTIISYNLCESSYVILKVFDLLGNKITVLVNEQQPAGNYSTEFNAGKLSSGIYIYSLTAGKFQDNKKMILTK